MVKRFLTGENPPVWWGAPKKFDPNVEERRVSWLELFYDLVYVIAISRITHHLAQHITIHGLFEYTSLFILIFWGWLNGSLYHDLHGNEGLRTRLMTLWQMMIISALAITLDQPSGNWVVNATVVFMIMQCFITYMWWSVGIYDKDHRRYNRPYTILFLVSLALMGVSLVLPPFWLKVIVPVVVLLNYLPPFIAQRLLNRSSIDLHLSTSMFERLGLFTIIVFGELVLGVVNGISAIQTRDLSVWVNFALTLSIVFSLWWIFFTLLSNREVKKGFSTATLLELLFIPTLISLGLMAASLTTLFDLTQTAQSLQKVFSFAVAIFLAGVSFMMGFLVYPEIVKDIIRPSRISLFVVAIGFLFWSFVAVPLESIHFLVAVLLILVAEITYVNALYYRLESVKGNAETQLPDIGGE